MYVEVVLFVVVIGLILFRNLVRKWTVLKKWNIPHDTPSLLSFGNVTNMFSKDAYKYELDCKRKYGNIWGWYLLTEPRIVVHDPDILRQILVKIFSAFPDRLKNKSDIGSRSLENGVLAVHTGEWKRMRTTLLPAFSSSKLKQMSPIFDWCVNNTIEYFKKTVQDSDGIFDASKTIHSLSLDLICSVTFSIDVDSLNTKPEPLVSKHAKGFFTTDIFALLTFALNNAFPQLIKWLPGNPNQGKHARYMKNICNELIRKRQSQGAGDDKNAKRHDIMDFMLDNLISDRAVVNGAVKRLTETEIFSNAATMILAAYDTTGFSMTCLAYNLAMHPNIQKKLQEKIDEAFAKQYDSDIDRVSNIKYLDMCINENLRLYSPIARSLRTSERDVTIQGLHIPKGTTITIPISSLSHEPEYWNDPTVFNPERTRNISDIDPMVFQPFGMGPRNCIGGKFALAEMKLAFCAILRRYSFQPTSNTPQPPLTVFQLLTTAPAMRFNLQIERRRFNTPNNPQT